MMVMAVMMVMIVMMMMMIMMMVVVSMITIKQGVGRENDFQAARQPRIFF